MNRQLLTLAATGVAGITLGLGVGVAAAQGDPAGDPTPPATAAEVETMDDMHERMRDQMPAELAEACDDMHESMPAGMASRSAGHMNGAAGMSNGQHQAHHK